ncbi:Phosphoglycerate dehydrogenase [Arthrobacter alpinus]|uniref:Phosphoglycerate dehydrogenase n=1 Tax=Arthrobacter alpinus TaxID=656366 RepID=A0A1H5IS66_9MICC|nr:hydroxyacid dehydrogenase [Arthrobacter alpinus]SEE43113.1 Phosphoglycerate dehydrogenase [Arthrobacter alpinus]
MSHPAPLPNVALAMPAATANRLFTARLLDALADGVNLLSREPLEDFSSAAALAVLANTDILITGWGCQQIDADVLDAAPRLRYILHAAGTVKNHVTEACWDRGIQVSTAADANALPVAEYTLAMILLANKNILQLGQLVHSRHSPVSPEAEFPSMGNYRKRVGIIGASKIGRHVIRLLRPFDVDVVVADPFLDDAEATVLGTALVTLEELASTSDVVSLHAPSLPSTLNLISKEIIASFGPGTTFINTARGELVDQDALLDRLQQGDLYAVLDVTTPWELPPDSGFYTNPNVLLTPHIAGSLGTELERLAATVVAEAHRVAKGEPLRHALPAEQLSITA